MTTSTFTDNRSARLDVFRGGAVHHECDDRPIDGVRLVGFSPQGCADDDFRTLEVTFPVVVRDEFEPQSWQYPGWRAHELTLDASYPTVVEFDGLQCCLLPAAAQELFDAIGVEDDQ